ncbi:hypothetical protein BD560DRAFT_396658 [Blakeslea trispora]|nr:hypothetical protein BD560DRAFT_396658 [Blakeslea trispora]
MPIDLCVVKSLIRTPIAIQQINALQVSSTFDNQPQLKPILASVLSVVTALVLFVIAAKLYCRYRHRLFSRRNASSSERQQATEEMRVENHIPIHMNRNTVPIHSTVSSTMKESRFTADYLHGLHNDSRPSSSSLVTTNSSIVHHTNNPSNLHPQEEDYPQQPPPSYRP